MKQSFLDKAIVAINPVAGARRLRAKMAIQIAEITLRNYEAATHGRRTANWGVHGTSANREIYQAGWTLRERARDLVRNNPYASKAIRVIASNTIGTGIQVSPITTNARVDKKIKSIWQDWAESKMCDHEGMHNFYALQTLVMRCVAESGEVLIRRRRDAKSDVPIKLQILEADFLDTSKDGYIVQGEGYVIQGVEFDSSGRRVAYWLFNRHPSDTMPFSYNITSNRVPVEDVIHIYKIERPGQVRGIPFGVSAFMRLKDFDDYEDAQLMRQKIAACYSVFITELQDTAVTITDPQNPKEVLEKVEPGIIQHLDPGQDIKFASPPGADGYDEYSRKILQAIATGYGITYEALTGELKDVNFSSARMGWLEFARQISEWQWQMIIPMFCEPVWRWFNEAAFLSGKIQVPYTPCQWTAPRREMIDPVKEIKGMVEAIRAGLKPWSEAVRELGGDPDTFISEIKKYNDLFDVNEFMLSCDPRYDTNRPAEEIQATLVKE